MKVARLAVNLKICSNNQNLYCFYPKKSSKAGANIAQDMLRQSKVNQCCRSVHTYCVAVESKYLKEAIS